METGTTSTLVNELNHGHDLARELESQLNPDSIEICKSLAQDILASIEKAIAMAKSNACLNLVAGGTGSPRSFNGSPCSDTFEHPFKDEPRATTPKKRKTQSKLTTQVKLGSGPEAQGPLDDGYSWRKYGQKEILGAKHPRAYYRCTHLKSQGCPAVKQVQRSDDNPALFEVTYRASHTCHRKSSPSPAATASSFPNLNHHNNQLLLSFQANLKVETESPESRIHTPATSPFSFPSTPADSVISPESHIFSPASTLDYSFKRSFTDAFITPTTSESNYLSTDGPSLQASEFDFTEIVSGVTPASNTWMLDMDFMSDLDTQFSWADASSYEMFNPTVGFHGIIE